MGKYRLQLLAVAIILAASPSYATSRYRLPATGDCGGTWDDTDCWSTTSGGSGGASVPTTSDDCILDAASGGGTIDASGAATAACKGFDASAIDDATTLKFPTDYLEVHGNLALSSLLTLGAMGEGEGGIGNDTSGFLLTATTGTIAGNGFDGGRLNGFATLKPPDITLALGTTYTLASNLIAPSAALMAQDGSPQPTFATGNYTLELGYLYAQVQSPFHVRLGTSTVTIHCKLDAEDIYSDNGGKIYAVPATTCLPTPTGFAYGTAPELEFNFGVIKENAGASESLYDVRFFHTPGVGPPEIVIRSGAQRVRGTWTIDPGVQLEHNDTDEIWAANLSCAGTALAPIIWTRSGTSPALDLSLDNQATCHYLDVEYLRMIGATEHQDTGGFGEQVPDGAVPLLVENGTDSGNNIQVCFADCPVGTYTVVPTSTPTTTPTGTPTQTPTRTPTDTPTAAPAGFCIGLVVNTPSQELPANATCIDQTMTGGYDAGSAEAWQAAAFPGNEATVTSYYVNGTCEGGATGVCTASGGGGPTNTPAPTATPTPTPTQRPMNQGRMLFRIDSTGASDSLPNVPGRKTVAVNIDGTASVDVSCRIGYSTPITLATFTATGVTDTTARCDELWVEVTSCDGCIVSGSARWR